MRRRLPGPFQKGAPYSDRDLKAIEDLKTHKKKPDGYKVTKASKAAYELLRDLALKPQMLHAFQKNPVSFLKRHVLKGKLSSKEEKAILSRHAGRLRMMMKDDSDAAEEFVQAVYRNVAMAKAWATDACSSQSWFQAFKESQSFSWTCNLQVHKLHRMVCFASICIFCCRDDLSRLVETLDIFRRYLTWLLRFKKHARELVISKVYSTLFIFVAWLFTGVQTVSICLDRTRSLKYS